MSLQESVHNYIFRGTITNGVITISGYESIAGAGITTNCLRGMYVISGYKHVGYVQSNTAWNGSGLTATMGYSTLTKSGIVNVGFVFPTVRKLYFNTAQVFSKVQCFLSASEATPTKTQVESKTQAAIKPSFATQVIMRMAPENVVTSQKNTIKIRGGVHVENY